MPVSHRLATGGDAGAIAGIYNHYIRDSVATFETECVTEAEVAGRIAETQDLGLPWFVASDAETVLGYAYASRWKGRCAYRYSVESTIYLAPSAIGRGIGRSLYAAVLDEVEAFGMHVAIGGISLPNEASVRLHEALGFRKIGQFEEIGYKFDRWIDVGYWQLTFR
jgi:L-amino acid N-acyltransferase YncA